MPEKQLQETFDESRIVAFIEKFISTLGVYQRYSADSRLASESAEGLFVQLMDIMSPTGRLTFSEFHNSLMLNDLVLSMPFQKTPLAGGFVFFMLEHNLRSIVLLGNCSLEDIKHFMSLLAYSPDKLRQSPSQTLDSKEIKGVLVEPQGQAQMGLSHLKSQSRVTIEPSPSSVMEIPQPPGEQKKKEKPRIQVVPQVPPPKPKPPVQPPPVVEKERTEFVDPEPDDESVTDGKTEVMFRPGYDQTVAPDTLATNVRRRIKAMGENQGIAVHEGDRPPGSVHLVVMTMLGRQVVDDVKVTILTDPEQFKITSSQRGASFFLLPQKYKIRIIYEKYVLHYDIELGKDIVEIQMDVNLLDAAR